MRTQFACYSFIWYISGTFKHKPHPCYKTFTIGARQMRFKSCQMRWSNLKMEKKNINNCTYYNHTYIWLWWNTAEEGAGRNDWSCARPRSRQSPEWEEVLRKVNPCNEIQAARRKRSWGAKKAECCLFKIRTNSLISNLKGTSAEVWKILNGSGQLPGTAVLSSRSAARCLPLPCSSAALRGA